MSEYWDSDSEIYQMGPNGLIFAPETNGQEIQQHYNPAEIFEDDEVMEAMQEFLIKAMRILAERQRTRHHMQRESRNYEVCCVIFCLVVL